MNIHFIKKNLCGWLLGNNIFKWKSILLNFVVAFFAVGSVGNVGTLSQFSIEKSIQNHNTGRSRKNNNLFTFTPSLSFHFALVLDYTAKLSFFVGSLMKLIIKLNLEFIQPLMNQWRSLFVLNISLLFHHLVPSMSPCELIGCKKIVLFEG